MPSEFSEHLNLKASADRAAYLRGSLTWALGSFEANVFFTRALWWFHAMNRGGRFWKYTSPIPRRSDETVEQWYRRVRPYVPGDSWLEEMGCSYRTFRTARSSVALPMDHAHLHTVPALTSVSNKVNRSAHFQARCKEGFSFYREKLKSRNTLRIQYRGNAHRLWDFMSDAIKAYEDHYDLSLIVRQEETSDRKLCVGAWGWTGDIDLLIEDMSTFVLNRFEQDKMPPSLIVRKVMEYVLDELCAAHRIKSLAKDVHDEYLLYAYMKEYMENRYTLGTNFWVYDYEWYLLNTMLGCRAHRPVHHDRKTTPLFKGSPAKGWWSAWLDWSKRLHSVYEIEADDYVRLFVHWWERTHTVRPVVGDVLRLDSMSRVMRLRGD